jgi:hypothetical protein
VRLRCAFTAIPPSFAQLGKNPGVQDGGTNSGTRGSFREPTQNLLPVWYDSIGAGAEAIEADMTDWHQALARVSGQLVHGEHGCRPGSCLRISAFLSRTARAGGSGASCTTLDGRGRG